MTKQSDIAKVLNLSVQRISQLVARGMPTESVERAVAWYRERIGAETPTAAAARVLQTAKARRTALEAKIAELQLKEKTGEMLNVDRVALQLADAGTAVREHLLGIAGRYADLFAVESDSRVIKRILELEIGLALQHLEGVTFKGG